MYIYYCLFYISKTISIYKPTHPHIHINTHATYYDNTLDCIARLMCALSEIMLYSRKWKFPKNYKLTKGTENKLTVKSVLHVCKQLQKQLIN